MPDVTGSRTPREALDRLRALASSGDLDRFCADRGLRLLVAFGSATEPEQAEDAQDLDIAVAFEPGAVRDLPRLIVDISELLGLTALDVVDLDRASIVLRHRALVATVPLFESRSGSYAIERDRAMMEYMDTAWLRRLDLEAMAQSPVSPPRGDGPVENRESPGPAA